MERNKFMEMKRTKKILSVFSLALTSAKQASKLAEKLFYVCISGCSILYIFILCFSLALGFFVTKDVLQAHIDMCGKKADKNFHFSL
jgi:hypothetical protein